MKEQEYMDFRETVRNFERSVDKLRKLTAKNQQLDVTVEESKITGLQQDMKASLAELIHKANSLVDGTGSMQIYDGETISLPDKALERNTSETVPEKPG